MINKNLDTNKVKNDNVNLKHIESNVMDDSIKAIKHMKTNDIQELTIKLRPKELGDMNIQLLKDGENMRAVVTVFNKDVFDSINKNMTDLKQHLELTNVNIKMYQFRCIVIIEIHLILLIKHLNNRIDKITKKT